MVLNVCSNAIDLYSLFLVPFQLLAFFYPRFEDDLDDKGFCSKTKT